MNYTLGMAMTVTALTINAHGIQARGLEDSIQWTTDGGGNGHWYLTVYAENGICWSDAYNQAMKLGGYLVTITSQAEQEFVADNSDKSMRAWLGGTKSSGSWEWVTSEPWDFTNWHPVAPNGDGPALGKDYGANHALWDDMANCNQHPSFIVEFDYLAPDGEDCNENGVSDIEDIANQTSMDCDQNGVPDECQPDCDGDGWIDVCDNDGDIDGDGIPDNCETDCNANGIPDDYEIEQGIVGDCNGNNIPDDCDISSNTSEDTNSNGIPDECETDCNSNGIEDADDISSGASYDCNGNGVPDECDVVDGCMFDCNMNGVPDSCDIAGGFSSDNNANGVPDECECIADINGDDEVNIHDLLALIGYWGSSGPIGDLNADGTVSIHDLLILVAGWGECTNVPCNPEPPIAGAVQWSIEEGGNGHWYATVLTESLCWSDAKIAAEVLGGYLVTITSSNEQAFVASASDSTNWSWMGGQKVVSSWQWVTGEEWNFTNWFPGEPNGDGNYLAKYYGANHPLWNDQSNCNVLPSYIIEFD
ncbi:MAG: hypothetical protein ISR75_06870 [Phycisphaerales bacterium]|nr:hypothetical protein [Planctomycetota bacterium]MBL6998141.1 hypothetical protein [Phycisphaerales bacterium]